MFGNMKTEKCKFYDHRNLILLEDLDIDNMQVSSLVSSGEKKNYKYFISLLDDDYKIKPLCIMLPKTGAYVKSYDVETKWMHFSIEEDELLEKYVDIWNNVGNSFKKELDFKPIYYKKFSKTKIKSFGDETTDFIIKKFPK